MCGERTMLPRHRAAFRSTGMKLLSPGEIRGWAALSSDSATTDHVVIAALGLMLFWLSTDYPA
jgi:hypothetical protein